MEKLQLCEPRQSHQKAQKQPQIVMAAEVCCPRCPQRWSADLPGLPGPPCPHTATGEPPGTETPPGLAGGGAPGAGGDRHRGQQGHEGHQGHREPPQGPSQGCGGASRQVFIPESPPGALGGRRGWREPGRAAAASAGSLAPPTALAPPTGGLAPPTGRSPAPAVRPPRRQGARARCRVAPERADRRRRQPKGGGAGRAAGDDGAAGRAAAGRRRAQGGAAGGHRAAARLPRRHQGQRRDRDWGVRGG